MAHFADLGAMGPGMGGLGPWLCQRRQVSTNCAVPQSERPCAQAQARMPWAGMAAWVAGMAVAWVVARAAAWVPGANFES